MPYTVLPGQGVKEGLRVSPCANPQTTPVDPELSLSKDRKTFKSRSVLYGATAGPAAWDHELPVMGAKVGWQRMTRLRYLTSGKEVAVDGPQDLQ